MFKIKTIQFKLFYHYSIFILGIILAFILTFYYQSATAVKRNASESLHQLADYIRLRLDNEIDKMDALSVKLLYSQPLKELFYSDIYVMDNQGLLAQRKFNEIIYSITGPDFNVYQINLFSNDGHLASIGNSNQIYAVGKEQVARYKWKDEVFERQGKKYLTIPHQDSWLTSSSTVISLCRSFSEIWGEEGDSIVEIQQEYDHLTELIRQSVMAYDHIAKLSKDVFVYNKKGQLIYPNSPYMSHSGIDRELYMNHINRLSDDTHLSTVHSSLGKKQVVAWVYSELTEWTIAVVVPEDEFLQPIMNLKNKTAIISLTILLLTMMVSYFVSRKLTKPIKKMHQNIKGLKLDALPTKPPMEAMSDIDELDELNLAFAEMCHNFKGSLEEVIAARNHEMQSRLLALQAQMNPHFLYNTLSTVSIMAEESGQGHIVRVCEDLSSMLRYITNNDTSQVPLQEEMYHTYNYLQLMKIRYEDYLIYEMDIEEELLRLMIPKLVIQPLVENAIKYGLDTEPPWHIHIKGLIVGHYWQVTVRDSGGGFSQENMMQINDDIEHLDRLMRSHKLQLDGMGLLNIVIRLRLLYGERYIFQFGNGGAGGAYVTIGGPLDEKGVRG